MKIRSVQANNHRKAFEVKTYKEDYLFPYASTDLVPGRANPIVNVYVDKELGNEAFTYVLKSGDENSVHIDSVLEYNKDPDYMRELLVYLMSVEAKKAVREAGISQREIIRRLGTSASQLSRLLDEKNTKTSVDQFLRLFHVLDFEVKFTVSKKETHTSNRQSRRSDKRSAGSLQVA